MKSPFVEAGIKRIGKNREVDIDKEVGNGEEALQ